MTEAQAIDPASTVFGTVSGELLARGVVGRARDENTSELTPAAVIPYDGTIPQVTEGVEILSVAYTPKVVGSDVAVEVNIPLYDTRGTVMQAALFVDGAANAVSCGYDIGAANYPMGMSFKYNFTPATTSEVTFSVRIGPSSGSMYFNRTNIASFNGVARATIEVVEYVL